MLAMYGESSIEAFFNYLSFMIDEIDNITTIHIDIIPDCMSKNLLQSHLTNNSSNWKPSFYCGSECIKLNVPDNQT